MRREKNGVIKTDTEKRGRKQKRQSENRGGGKDERFSGHCYALVSCISLSYSQVAQAFVLLELCPRLLSFSFLTTYKVKMESLKERKG